MRDKALQVRVSGVLSGSWACEGDGIISLGMADWLLRGIYRHWPNHGRRRPAGQKRGSGQSSRSLANSGDLPGSIGTMSFVSPLMVRNIGRREPGNLDADFADKTATTSFPSVIVMS